MKAALNYTTSVPVNRTVTEVQTMLAEAGAGHVTIAFTDMVPSGVTFHLETVHGWRTYTLPCDIPAMQRLLTDQDRAGVLKSGSRAARTSRAQAERVAWRVLKDWLSAQLTLVEAGMAVLPQVMLPYLHTDGERTLYQVYAEREQRAIEQ
jgi:hypothetical protein